MKTIDFFGPATSWKWWGFFLLPMALLPMLAGCAGTPVVLCGGPIAMGFSATEDSLGLDEFLALPDAEQQARRRLARRFLAEADGAGRADLRIRSLTNAAGVAPDDPAIWLRLAKVWRWVGDYLATDTSLTNAATAVRAFDVSTWLEAERGFDYGNIAGLETALQRAWLHYDRGEWREAMPWVRAALTVESGNTEVLRIRGLLEARQGKRGMAHQIADDLRRKDEFSADISWVMFNLDTAMGRHRAAYNYCYTLRPNQRNAAECYRDMGRTAERVREWSFARRWYRESTAALPFRNITCLTEINHKRVSDPAGTCTLPFWMAFDQYYVTGSLSAYLAYAFDRFEAASTAAEKELWGGLVVNAAGICLRLEMEKPHVRRVRGLVFARTGRGDRAMADLEAAVAGLGPNNALVADLEAEIGHLMLVEQNHARAAVHLRRSLAAKPDLARAWSDLGLALIMADDQAAAAEALTKAIELDKSLAAAWYNRGLMHFHAGDLDLAESDLAEAARLAPDNRDVANLLQRVMRQKKQR